MNKEKIKKRIIELIHGANYDDVIEREFESISLAIVIQALSKIKPISLDLLAGKGVKKSKINKYGLCIFNEVICEWKLTGKN